MAKPFKPRAKDLPTINLVRCYHCNTAFYQDAE